MEPTWVLGKNPKLGTTADPDPGFHGFSFQDVADEVGIRKASLYHYFASKMMLHRRVERATGWVIRNGAGRGT